MKKGIGRIGLVATTLIAGVVASVAQAGTAGYVVDPPVVVSVAALSGTNYWQNTSGQGLRIVDVTSSATGGTLSVKVDMMVGGAGVIFKPACGGSTLSVTNSTSRSLTGSATDYVWPGQRVYFYTEPGLAAHKIFMPLERKE